MSKENIFKLTGHAGKFVKDNIAVLKKHNVVLFPCFLALALINHLATVYGKDWIIYLTALPFLYVLSCFSLGWHGVSLKGADQADVKTPFVWRRGDGRFHVVFIGIMVFVLGFNVAAEQVTLYLEHTANQALVIVGAISSLIVLCAVLYYAVQFMFALPALSVGVSLSYEDIRKSSKGSMLRFIGSTILTSVTFVLLMSIYLLIVSVILQATGSNAEATNVSSALVAFFLSIPLYMAVFFYWAVNVTILSRLYTWGMQNNA